MLLPGTKLEAEADSHGLRTLKTPQNYCLSKEFGKESYTRAFRVIELFHLVKIFRRTIEYLCGSHLDKNYEALYGKLFAFDSPFVEKTSYVFIMISTNFSGHSSRYQLICHTAILNLAVSQAKWSSEACIDNQKMD